MRLRDESGRLAATVIIMKPEASMVTPASVITQSDPRHLKLMHQVARARRRPAAIFIADLEGSTPLSRRLSTAATSLWDGDWSGQPTDVWSTPVESSAAT